MYCKYSEYVNKSVIEQYLNCSLTQNLCLKQKFCNKQKKVINTDDWQNCQRLLKKEKDYENKNIK